MRLFENVRPIDVQKYTVTMTDLRTGETSVKEIYRPEWIGSERQLGNDLGYYGYRVESIEAETVSCPINWAHVFGFYSQTKGNADEGLEQTTEAETVSAE